MILDSLPVFFKKILTCFRQESENEQYRNTLKDLLLSNTVAQKDEKPHTAGQDDTVIPHIKIKITEIPLEKKAQYRNTVNPHVPLCCRFNERATIPTFFDHC